MGQSNPQRRVDSPMNLLVTVAILLECDLEKLQLIIQAVLVTQSCSSVYIFKAM
jgi:hypothetical protein